MIRRAGFAVVMDPRDPDRLSEFSPESDLPAENAPERDPYFSGVQKVMEMIQ